MAWQWTDVKQAKDGAYVITATEDSDPSRVISFIAHKDRVTPEELAKVLQEKVDILNARTTDEANKLAWAIANIDISGVS